MRRHTLPGTPREDDGQMLRGRRAASSLPTYIYEPTDTSPSSPEGWEVERATRLDEPVVDRHDEHAESSSSPKRKTIGPSFFTLSGGILKRDPRTSNRIDSMLTRMLEDGSVSKYSPHVDKNLDYLHTCLQLDMISMVALDLGPTLEDRLDGTESERV